MRKLTLFLLTAAISAVAYPPVARAARPAECEGGQNGTVIDCHNEASAGNPADTSIGLSRPSNASFTSSSSSSGPAKKYVPYNKLVTGADGNPCITTGYVEEGITPPEEPLIHDTNPREFNLPVTGTDFSFPEHYPPCPEEPRAPGSPAASGSSAPVETRSLTAARYWERIPLPKPQPAIAPGRAITGKLAYLETKGEVAHTYTNATRFGPLEIVAKGTYMIDWGDGETSGPHGFEGKAWPDGKITHDYLKIGRYNVIVTEKWTATWSLDGEHGVLRTLQTTGRIDNFPVEQIQAVVVR